MNTWRLKTRLAMITIAIMTIVSLTAEGITFAETKAHHPPETPIAILFFAGYKDKERIVRGRLDTILQSTQTETFPFEHQVYVGDFMN